MALEALVFDVDGTIVDTEELHRRAFNQAFLEFELGWDWAPEVYARLLRISGGDDRIVHHIGGLPISDLEKLRLRRLVPGLHREKTRIYGELVARNMVKPRPGIARLIREARAAGLKIGLAATSASANVQPLIGASFTRETASAIDAVVSADLVSNRKPAPDIYLLLLSMLGVPPEHCVAFEDSANGVAAAQAAGMVTIATPSRWTQSQDFSHADLKLGSLGEPDQPLAQADSVAVGGVACVGLDQLRALLEFHGTSGKRAALQNKRLAPR
ncbi:MAG: HAD-IA family hydrolase [Pseudorhodoplanes sp.]